MLHDRETDEVAADPQFSRDLLAASGPDADAPVVRRQVYTFHARVADKWRSRRIFLAGDAAHLSPPFAGQGMNAVSATHRTLAGNWPPLSAERSVPA